MTTQKRSVLDDDGDDDNDNDENSCEKDDGEDNDILRKGKHGNVYLEILMSILSIAIIKHPRGLYDGDGAWVALMWC